MHFGAPSLVALGQCWKRTGTPIEICGQSPHRHGSLGGPELTTLLRKLLEKVNVGLSVLQITLSLTDTSAPPNSSVSSLCGLQSPMGCE
jgi:hypothetical protein